MVKKIILLALVFFQSQVQAQDPYKNEAKYWFYRYRLLTEFIVNGGDACGDSAR
jgi:hypothetical protein